MQAMVLEDIAPIDSSAHMVLQIAGYRACEAHVVTRGELSGEGAYN